MPRSVTTDSSSSAGLGSADQATGRRQTDMRTTPQIGVPVPRRRPLCRHPSCRRRAPTPLLPVQCTHGPPDGDTATYQGSRHGLHPDAHRPRIRLLRRVHRGGLYHIMAAPVKQDGLSDDLILTPTPRTQGLAHGRQLGHVPPSEELDSRSLMGLPHRRFPSVNHMNDV
ncbi:hypothetical protein BC827DRAFT_133994 [Russula dissimulans]|nr:hypothetical protein BC827DRAFT_133994 [Russula dissimulans]